MFITTYDTNERSRKNEKYGLRSYYTSFTVTIHYAIVLSRTSTSVILRPYAETGCPFNRSFGGQPSNYYPMPNDMRSSVVFRGTKGKFVGLDIAPVDRYTGLPGEAPIDSQKRQHGIWLSNYAIGIRRSVRNSLSPAAEAEHSCIISLAAKTSHHPINF